MTPFLSTLVIGSQWSRRTFGGLAAVMFSASLSGCILTETTSGDCMSGYRSDVGCAGTPMPSCEESCAALRQDEYMSCMDAGNHGEVCQEEALAAYDSCMIGACGVDSSGASTTEPATDPSTGASSGSGDAGDGSEEAQPPTESGSSGGTSTEPVPGDVSSPDSDCAYSCQMQASQYFEECVASGIPQEDCERNASSLFDSCLTSCQGSEPPPPATPPTSSGSSECSESCQAFAQGVYTECMVSTGDPLTCEDHAQLALQSCLFGCDQGSVSEPVPTDPPPPQDCFGSCEERAMMMYDDCMTSGQDPELCQLQFNDMLESCYSACTGEPIPPDPSQCQSDCEQRARLQLEECLAAGNDPERCELQYQQTLDSCVQSCQSEPPPPTNDCAVGCEEKARLEFESCLASGADPQRCEQLYQDTYNSCMQSCTASTTPVPIPVDQECSMRCEEQAMDVYNVCVASGGDQVSCKEKYTVTLESCLSSCG